MSVVSGGRLHLTRLEAHRESLGETIVRGGETIVRGETVVRGGEAIVRGGETTVRGGETIVNDATGRDEEMTLDVATRAN